MSILAKFPCLEYFPKTDKVWGTEFLVTNTGKYCSKFLLINPGHQCSLHFHPDKQETFAVLDGLVRLEYGKEIRYMATGNTELILPGTPHRFSSMSGALILETSTQHSDQDVVRIENSKKTDAPNR